ncbi:MAG: ribonuclease III [Oscillospiraceae bacterium]|nr:ribonuclease III [Oscillospiraceae bacterium]
MTEVWGGKVMVYKVTDELKELQQKLQYTFKDGGLLVRAMSHSSYVNEKQSGMLSNERLEFLGDSVLGFITADHYFSHYGNMPEGELTKMRASAVCERSLCEFAKELELGKYLMLGKGEVQTGGRERPSILADAFEALIAAVYLDGGMGEARRFVLRYVSREPGKTGAFHDYKTILQEVIQRNPEEAVEYVHVRESGPDHDKCFEVEVHLNSNVIGAGKGRSKKIAEQEAAKEALALMGIEP